VELLYDIPTPLLVMLLFILMVATLEGAQRLGARLEAETWQRSREFSWPPPARCSLSSG